MKVSICTGTKCSFYGATHIISELQELQEYLHTIDGMPEDAELEIELLPCRGFCKRGNHGVAPIVYVEDQIIERATSPIVQEIVLDKLMKGEN